MKLNRMVALIALSLISVTPAMAAQGRVQARISCSLPDDTQVQKLVSVKVNDPYNSSGYINLAESEKQSIGLALNCVSMASLKRCSMVLLQTVNDKQIQSRMGTALPSRGVGGQEYTLSATEFRDTVTGANSITSDEISTDCKITLKARN